MTFEEACVLAGSVRVGRPRSYVSAAQELASYVLDRRTVLGRDEAFASRKSDDAPILQLPMFEELHDAASIPSFPTVNAVRAVEG